MQTSHKSDAEIIGDFEAVRLLINTYLIKKVKSTIPVNQEKFIDSVYKEIRKNGYCYNRKQILYTWKYLLDNYRFFKENYSEKDAREFWTYFTLMDNCFDDSKPTCVKFKDPKWTFLLIHSLNNYKQTVLSRQGLTMDILQAVENNFHEEGNYDINQKDIYNQWIFLYRFYRQHQKSGNFNLLVCKSQPYFTALKEFFESEETLQQKTKSERKRSSKMETDLLSAIESIKDDEIKQSKRLKTDVEAKNPTMSDEKFVIEDQVDNTNTTPFNIVMHDILLNCFKKHKLKVRDPNGGVDEEVLNETFEEFQKRGYNVTKKSISNEWYDLSCRYELIKSSEHPQKWPHYDDMLYIFNSKDSNEANLMDDTQSTIGSIIVENLRKNHHLNRDDYVGLTERLLNVYEANSKEFLEIRDILEERNLLREETNYLLNMFVEKFNKKKENSSNDITLC